MPDMNFIQHDEIAEEFICFEGFRKVEALKFYAPLPTPPEEGEGK